MMAPPKATIRIARKFLDNSSPMPILDNNLLIIISFSNPKFSTAPLRIPLPHTIGIPLSVNKKILSLSSRREQLPLLVVYTYPYKKSTFSLIVLTKILVFFIFFHKIESSRRAAAFRNTLSKKIFPHHILRCAGMRI